MQISVIIPMYNAERTIKRCVASAVSQEVYEILLVDDGSSDGTRQAAYELGGCFGNVRVLEQNHGGVSKARNLGIREAKGDWILFLDADDCLLENAVMSLTENLDPETDACCGGTCRGSGRKIKTGQQSGLVFENKRELMDYVLASPTDWLTVHGWIFRRNICTEHKICFNPELRLGEDSDWVLRVLSHCRKARFTPQTVYQYTISSDSTINRWKPGQTAGYLQMLREIGKTPVREEKNWPLFVLTTLLLILTHDTFHPANPADSRKKLLEAKKLRESRLFSDALNRADLSLTGKGKKWTLQCLKRRLYLPVWIAVKIRQRQNAGYAEKDGI